MCAACWRTDKRATTLPRECAGRVGTNRYLPRRQAEHRPHDAATPCYAWPPPLRRFDGRRERAGLMCIRLMGEARGLAVGD